MNEIVERFPKIEVDTVSLTEISIRNCLTRGLLDTLRNSSASTGSWLSLAYDSDNVEKDNVYYNLIGMFELLGAGNRISYLNEPALLVNSGQLFSGEVFLKIARKEADRCLKIYEEDVSVYLANQEVELEEGESPLTKLFSLISEEVTSLIKINEKDRERIFNGVARVKKVFQGLADFSTGKNTLLLMNNGVIGNPKDLLFDFTQL